MKIIPSRKRAASKTRGGAALAGCLIKAGVAGLVGVVFVGVLGYMTFFSTSHHDTPSSMFPMYGDLTPPKATDITLHAAGLDHTAEYTVSQADLERFLEAYFQGFEGPDPIDEEWFDRVLEGSGGVDWPWHEGVVNYDMWMARGTSHRILYDPKTARAYQESAHW